MQSFFFLLHVRAPESDSGIPIIAKLRKEREIWSVPGKTDTNKDEQGVYVYRGRAGLGLLAQ